MKMSLLLIVLAVLLAGPAAAQSPATLHVGLGAGYAEGEMDAHGASADLAVGLRWRRLLVQAHVAEVAYEYHRLRIVDAEGTIRTESGRDLDYGVGLTVGYAQPVAGAVSAVAGLGWRSRRVDLSGPPEEGGGWGHWPSLLVGVLVGPPGALNGFARVEVSRAYDEPFNVTRMHAGVLVPLRGLR